MDSSSKLNSSNTTKPMGEIVSSNTSNINNINNNNNMSINIGGSSSSNSRMRSKEMENLSFEISKYPRDLLQRFLGGGGGNSSQQSRRISSVDDSIIGGNEEEDEDDDEGGLNLGLGLSLGGKFGVDKSNKGLIRSSSIAGTMPLFTEQDDGTVVVAPPPLQPPCRGGSGGGGGGGGGGLVRTSSLPVETEEEWRKRKEMQTLRRMEAKRRRFEKQRGLKDGGGGGNGGGGGGGEEKGGVEGLKFRGRLEREQQSLGITSKFIGSSMGNLFGSSTPPPPPPSSNVEVKGRRTTFGSLQGFLIAQGHAPGSGSGSGLGQSQGQGQGQQGSSQGSGESQGGTSSGASELESKTHQASSSCGEARSPASTQSLQERPSQDSLGSPGALKGGGDTSQREERGPEMESSSKQPKASSGIEDMPCVFTIGDGPNGRKVEGILYRYGKGEQVRIMCVCHGTFLSPRDFVKHAGGRDVEHPLRHIVVSPSSSAFQ